MAELLCAAGGIEYTAARCFTFAGPQLPFDGPYALGNFIRDALRGGPIRVLGDGLTLRSYLYAADMAWWLWTLLFRGRAGEAYNVGSEEAVSVADVAHMIAGSFDPPVPIDVTLMRDSGTSQYLPSTEKARTELKLQSTVPLKDSIVRTIDYHRN